MGLLEAIESSAIAEWVRSSPSIFAYTGVLSLHAIGLAIAVGVNTVIALRMLGYGDYPLQSLRRLFPLFYAGFTINLISGSMLLAASLSTNLGRWMFLTKLGFIVLAMINFEVMRAKVFRPSAVVGGAIAGDERGVRKYAWIALILWGLAIISGRLTSYPTFVEAVFGF